MDAQELSALFPPIDRAWLERARKRFASPFMGTKFDRIAVDPMMLSHAAVVCGFTIGDFYKQPELGASCVAYASQLYDLLPVTHWYFSLPWISELGGELRYTDLLPPTVSNIVVKTPEDVDLVEVPGIEEIRKGWTYSQMTRSNDFIKENIPEMFVPIASVSDLPGSAGQLCGVETFIMWTLTEPDLAHKLTAKYTETAIEGTGAIADRYGMAMISTGSVLGNNDIFSDQAVLDYSAKYLRKLVEGAFRKGAGPQLFYHMCGNHETDYKVFKDVVIWSPFTIIQLGYKGRDVFPADEMAKEFGQLATVMGSVDTRLMIDPNPRAVYEQASRQIVAGRDSPNGFILGTACETPPYTIPGNIYALVQATKDHGTYGHW